MTTTLRATQPATSPGHQPDSVTAVGVTLLENQSGHVSQGTMVSTSSSVEAIELELGVELHPLAHPLSHPSEATSDSLQARIRNTRRELSHQLGFTVPPVHIRRTLGLPVDAFRINIQGQPLSTRKTHGEDVRPSSIVVENLTRAIIEHAHRLLTREQIEMKVEMLRSNCASRMDGHIPTHLTTRTIHQVACRILQQHAPIADFETLVLTLIRATDPTNVDQEGSGNISRLTRITLRALRGFPPFQEEQDPSYGEASVLPVITLTPALESYITSGDISPRVCRSMRDQFVAHLKSANRFSATDITTVITRPDLQSRIRDVVALIDDPLKVITWQDVPVHRHVCVLGTIDACTP